MIARLTHYRSNPHYHCDDWYCPFCGANKARYRCWLGDHCPDVDCGHGVLVYTFEGKIIDPTIYPQVIYDQETTGPIREREG